MKVMMEVQTAWDGQSLRPGDQVNVDDAVGRRWIARKLASECKERVNVENADPQKVAPETPLDLSALTVKELRTLMTERDLDFEGLNKAKLIEALTPKAEEV